jgi:hypothetical protein
MLEVFATQHRAAEMYVLTSHLHAIADQEACHGSTARKRGWQGMEAAYRGLTNGPDSTVARHILVSAKSNGPRAVFAREWSQ